MIDAKLDTTKTTVTLEVPEGNAAAGRKVVELGMEAARYKLADAKDYRDESSITYDPDVVSDAELAELELLAAVKLA